MSDWWIWDCEDFKSEYECGEADAGCCCGYIINLLLTSRKQKKRLPCYIYIDIYTGWPISNRTDYFFNCSLIRRKLALIFLPHILDGIGQKCQEAKIFRCGSMFQNV